MCRLRGLMAWLVVLAVSLPSLSGSVAGDGGFFIHDTAYDRWGLAEETTQFGLINYDDGYEKLIISIKVPQSDLQRSDRSVWLFPVPSPADGVNIGLVEKVSALGGQRLVKLAEESLRDDMIVIASTQLYPVIVTIPASLSMGYGATSTLGGDSKDDVEIFETVMAFGVTTEIIEADSSSALYQYLASLGLDLPSDADPIVQDYVDLEYSFVASWISNMTDFLATAPTSTSYGMYQPLYSFGVSIGFHSDRIFYPLKLTSVYGEAVVPMLVQVLGYVSPHSSPKGADMKADFMFANFASFDPSLAEFFGRPNPGEYSSVVLENLKYTEIVIDSEASTLTEDLWLDDSPTAAARALDLLVSNSWALSVPLFLGASMLASLMAGMIVFRSQRPSGWRFALLGLLNSATIVGLWLGARLMRIDEAFIRDRSKPVAPHSVTAFVGVFTVLFLVIMIATAGGFFIAIA